MQTTMQTKKTYSAPAFKLISMILIATSLIACQGEPAAKSLNDESYTTLKSPLSVSTGEKIEVTELFWYGCAHCFALEPHIDKWKKDMPENAEFVKVPAIFSQRWEFHGQAFYTMQALGVLEQTHGPFFHQIHVMKKPIVNLPALIIFLAKYDRSAEQVTSAFNSFEVDTKLRNAKMITAKSTANGVPAIIVDGKYHTSVTLAGSQDGLFEVIDLLVAKAASER